MQGALPLGAGIGIGNLGISSLQGALGAGIGVGNLGLSSLQGALGAGIGVGNLGISSLQGALGAGIGIGNLGISSVQGATYRLGLGGLRLGRARLPPGGRGAAYSLRALPRK